MKFLYRWISEHTGLCRALLFLLLACFTFLAASYEHATLIGIYLVDLAVWFTVSRFIASAPGKLLQEPLRILDQQCDPYPLLQEAQRQMSRSDATARHQLTALTYALALHMVGETRKCADTLEKINIDRYPGTMPYTKFIYYNNLSDVLFALDRTEEAQIWHRKAMQIYNDLPENKAKQQLSETVQLSEAEALYRSGSADEALRKAARVKLTSSLNVMDAAVLAAKCHIALEEPEKAREKLIYVAERGNKLHIAQEAKALLETLD